MGRLISNQKYLYIVSGAGLSPNINGLRFYDSGLTFNGAKSYYSEDNQYAIWRLHPVWIIGSVSVIGTSSSGIPSWGRNNSSLVGSGYIGAGGASGNPVVSLYIPNNKISINKQNLGGGKLLAAKQFYPSDLNGLALWLRADAGVTYDGSNNVSAWADQSGNGKNATATGTQRPLYVSSDINGMPVISFDGVDDRLIGPNVISSTPCTIIIVAKFSSSEEIGVIFEQYDTYDNIALYRGFNGGTSRNFRLYNGADLTSSATTNDNQAYIFEAIVNGSNSYLYLNGSQTAFGNAGNLIPEGNYYLGYWRGGNAARTMKIAEVIVYNRAITTQERQQVESYLNAKYNIY